MYPTKQKHHLYVSTRAAQPDIYQTKKRAQKINKPTSLPLTLSIIFPPPPEEPSKFINMTFIKPIIVADQAQAGSTQCTAADTYSKKGKPTHTFVPAPQNQKEESSRKRARSTPKPTASTPSPPLRNFNSPAAASKTDSAPAHPRSASYYDQSQTSAPGTAGPPRSHAPESLAWPWPRQS